MNYAKEEIQLCVGASKEAPSNRKIPPLSRIISDACRGKVIRLPRPPLLLESNKVKWKSANFSGIALGDILVM